MIACYISAFIIAVATLHVVFEDFVTMRRMSHLPSGLADLGVDLLLQPVRSDIASRILDFANALGLQKCHLLQARARTVSSSSSFQRRSLRHLTI